MCVEGVIQGCNFSWTLFWRFELDPDLWEQQSASMMALLEMVSSGQVVCPGAVFGGDREGRAMDNVCMCKIHIYKI